MRFLIAVVVLALSVAPREAEAQRSPVLVELFTSQGCNSCPPADALLARLSEEPGIIALGLHVDYWDYLGWQDTFGMAENTERQLAYAKAGNGRTLYTPQIVVQGTDRLIGHKAGRVIGAIERHRALPPPVRLALERDGEDLLIRLAPLRGETGQTLVHIVRFIPKHSVAIEAGENAGHKLSYTNIVTDWETVGRWNGRDALELRAKGAGGEPLAVIVQRGPIGPVLAAAELR